MSKNIILYLILFYISTSFLSCDEKDVDHPKFQKEASVSVFYINKDKKKFPDIGSDVYLYYNIDEYLYSYNVENQFVELNGMLRNYDGEIIYPDEMYKIDNEGKALFIIDETSSPILIITISNFYQRVSISRFRPPIDYTIFYDELPKSGLSTDKN